MRYVAAASVRHVEVEGLRVILDMATETYQILDDAASALWPVLIGERDPAAAFAAVAADFDIDEPQWRAELQRFAERCVAEGLLTTPDTALQAFRDAPAPPAARNLPASLGAVFCVLATRRSLDQRGFRATYESYARMVPPSRPAPLEPSLAAFRRAENLFVAGRAPGDCLLRSLSLFRFLRSRGCEATHVIGVRRFAFNAHAWVESGGRALLDERAAEFTPIARIGPRPTAAG